MAPYLPGPGKPGNFVRRAGFRAFLPFYHAVAEEAPLHLKHLYPVRTPKQFEADLDELLSYFEPVGMEDILEGKEAANGKMPMHLSFDDGLVECYEVIMPILLKKGIPATFFLNNDFIDNRGLFYRYKVSLLVDRLENSSREGDAGRRLLALAYEDTDKIDRLAAGLDYSFEAYLQEHPVYMRREQIRALQEHGFELGSHSRDHALFSGLGEEEIIAQVKESMLELQERFSLKKRYFAFPFTDDRVSENTLARLFGEGIVDAGFGTAGLKDESLPSYFQRVPMEWKGLSARKVLRGEMNRARIRGLIGDNRVHRK